MAPQQNESPNRVEISDAGPSRKKLKIEIPAQTVAEHLGTSLDTALVEAELPGFRKGRVPRRLVEKKFGTAIRREAKNALVAEAFNKAIEDHKLRVVGDATSEMLDKVDIREGEALTFEIEVEVRPEFDLPSLDGIEVKKPLIEITDEMVKTEVDRLLLNEGELKSKEKPEAGDYLTGHAVMTGEGGKVHLDIQDAVIQIPTPDKNGKGMILGVVVDDFSKQIGLPAIGSTATVKTTGPQNHENEEIRGKPLSITFTVKRADEIVPAPIETLAERYGMASADELRQAVKTRIEQRIQVDQQSAMRQQVAKHLLEKTTFDLPQRLTAQQAMRNLERARYELMYRGVDAARIEENLANLRAQAGAQAVGELKLFFILDKAAEQFDVKVSEAEINGRIAQIAASRGERPEKLRQEIIARNQVGMIFTQIREHKTMDVILSKAKVAELPLAEFQKTFGTTQA